MADDLENKSEEVTGTTPAEWIEQADEPDRGLWMDDDELVLLDMKTRVATFATVREAHGMMADIEEFYHMSRRVPRKFGDLRERLETIGWEVKELKDAWQMPSTALYEPFIYLLGAEEVMRIREIAGNALIDEIELTEEMEDSERKSAKMLLLHLELNTHAAK